MYYQFVKIGNYTQKIGIASHIDNKPAPRVRRAINPQIRGWAQKVEAEQVVFYWYHAGRPSPTGLPGWRWRVATGSATTGIGSIWNGFAGADAAA
jgi:hypothetical protein